MLYATRGALTSKEAACKIMNSHAMLLLFGNDASSNM